MPVHRLQLIQDQKGMQRKDLLTDLSEVRFPQCVSMVGHLRDLSLHIPRVGCLPVRPLSPAAEERTPRWQTHLSPGHFVL